MYKRSFHYFAIVHKAAKLNVKIVVEALSAMIHNGRLLRPRLALRLLHLVEQIDELLLGHAPAQLAGLRHAQEDRFDLRRALRADERDARQSFARGGVEDGRERVAAGLLLLRALLQLLQLVLGVLALHLR